MNIKNETITAPKDLASFIDGIWITTAEGEPNNITPVQCCLPNGSWEIIFQLTEERFCMVIDGEQVWMPEMAGFAINGSPIYWQAQGGALFYGIMLQPEALELLTKRPSLLREARFEDLRQYNQPVFETLLLRGKGARSVKELADMIFATMREFLLQSETDHQLPYFTEALRLIRNNTVAQNLDDLSEQVFVSKRQLQRAFLDKLGYGPKVYSRILRFRNAIHFMVQHPGMRMTDVAYDFGYADQSHFIREFKDFTGQNPRTFFSAWKPASTVLSYHKTCM